MDNMYLNIKKSVQPSAHSSVSRGSKGMTLVEVMIIIGVLGIVALGMTSMMANISKTQRKDDVKVTLKTLMENLESTITDDSAWARTVESYPFGSAKLIDCLRDTAPAASECVTGSSASDINIRAPDGTLYYQGEDPTQGFNELGQNCSTYVPAPGAGNDACPFRIQTTVSLTCYTGASCADPKVDIDLGLTMNPLSKGDPRFNINTAMFDKSINRNDIETYEPFQVRHWQNNATALAANAPGGSCNYGGWAIRVINDEVYDQGGNVTVQPSGAFRLRPGAYKCIVTTQSFHQPEGYRIRLRMGGAPSKSFPIGGGLTDPFTHHSLTGTASFRITAERDLFVEHYCPVSPAFGTTNNFNTAPASGFHLGLPLPDYNEGSSFTKVDCVRSS